MKKRQNLEEEKTKRFNGLCYLIKQSFQTFLEAAEEYSICFIMLRRSEPQLKITYSSGSKGLDVQQGNK